MKTYRPTLGSRIAHACKELAAMAQASGESVEMNVNDILVVAGPSDSASELESRWHTQREIRYQEWRNSPEGVVSAIERQREIRRKQAVVDRLISEEIPFGWIPLLKWAEELTESADDIDVRFDPAALAKKLGTRFEENFGVGNNADWFSTPDRFGGYIMGQIINCLKSGMPPHPVTLIFIERFRKQHA